MEISGKTQQYPLHRSPSPAGRDQRLHAAAVPQTQAVRENENDDVELSADRTLIRRAIETAKAIPDVRSDRIAMIRQRLESGSYTVQAERIVSGLMTEARENDSILKQIDANT